MPDSKSIAHRTEDAFDQYAQAYTTIDEKHRMIHDGFSFHSTGRVASLAGAASHNILIAVPALTFPHFNGILFSIGDAPLDIKSYEGTLTSAQGTVITPQNRNRNSSITPDVVITHTPTITNDGTLIHDRYVPDAGGTGNQSVGTISPNFGEEWILKPSTQYLVRLTNNSGGAITVAYEILWYEIGTDE